MGNSPSSANKLVVDHNKRFEEAFEEIDVGSFLKKSEVSDNTHSSQMESFNFANFAKLSGDIIITRFLEEIMVEKSLKTLKMSLRRTEIQEIYYKIMIYGLARAAKSLKEVDFDFSCIKINTMKSDFIQGMMEMLGLGELETLKLDFSENEMESSSFRNLWGFYVRLSHLKSLNLDFSSNRIKSDGTSYLATAFKKLTQLESLTLNFAINNIGFEGGCNIMQALQPLKKLTYLNLNMMNNYVRTEGVIYLTHSLKEMTDLKILVLNLPSNSLEDECLPPLLRALSSLKELKSLNLNLKSMSQNNQLFELPSTIENLEIDFGCNSLENTNEGVDLMLPSSGQMTQLQLSFTYCKINESIFQKVLNKIDLYKRLYSFTLDLRSNDIRSSTVDKILNTVRKLELLFIFRINLQKNHLSLGDFIKILQYYKETPILIDFKISFDENLYEGDDDNINNNSLLEKISKFLEKFAALRRRYAYFVHSMTRAKGKFRRKMIYEDIFSQAEYLYQVQPGLNIIKLKQSL